MTPKLSTNNKFLKARGLIFATTYVLENDTCSSTSSGFAVPEKQAGQGNLAVFALTFLLNRLNFALHASQAIASLEGSPEPPVRRPENKSNFAERRREITGQLGYASYDTSYVKSTIENECYTHARRRGDIIGSVTFFFS